MECHYCGCQDTRVIDSRDTNDHEAVRRRRQCVACDRRFTTYERVELPTMKVVKRDGSVEDFDRDKIEVGLIRACEKRPVQRSEIHRVVDEVKEELRREHGDKVESEAIGEKVLEKLEDLDEVAYVRFASVYKSFGDAEHFQEELERLGIGRN
jgi:transcriptional repressor NrdR